MATAGTSSVLYASPWDFEGDEAAAGRAAALGVDAVAVAASYHATRAARPLHPGAPLVQVEHAALYVPVRPAAWTGRLVPRSPTWVSDSDSFGAARTALSAVGLRTCAWIVLTHNSALGAAHPDLVVRNAFGTAYPYALCPSAAAVQEYCATLVDEVLLAGPVDGVVLEACGPMGLEHNGLHEKTSLAGWTPAQVVLLSVCFCAACADRYAEAGLDVLRLQELVRRAARDDPGSVEQALGDDATARLRDVRTGIAAELRRLCVERVRHRQPAARVTLHGTADPWATGSFATVAPSPEPSVEALVGQWFDPSGTGGLRALRALDEQTALGAFVRPTDDWADEDVRRERLAALHDAGVSELHLYHLGLVGPRGLRTLAGMREAFSRPGSRWSPA